MKASELFKDKATYDYIKEMCQLFGAYVVKVTDPEGNVIYKHKDCYDDLKESLIAVK